MLQHPESTLSNILSRGFSCMGTILKSVNEFFPSYALEGTWGRHTMCCRLRNYCDSDSADQATREAFEVQGRSFFCSDLDSDTGLPTGNDFNWAVMHMLMVRNEGVQVRGSQGAG